MKFIVILNTYQRWYILKNREILNKYTLNNKTHYKFYQQFKLTQKYACVFNDKFRRALNVLNKNAAVIQINFIKCKLDL